MNKFIYPLLLSTIFLMSCAGSPSPLTTNKDSSSVISNSIKSESSSHISSSSQTEPKEIVPVSIRALGKDKEILYGSVLDEVEYNVVLTFSDGSEKVLSKSEYTLIFQKDAAFQIGEGKAVLTYSKNESISNEVKYHVVPRKQASILFIGNSFSDDTIEYMHNVASSLGIGLTINNLYIGGCTLDVHYNNLLNNFASYEYRYWNGTKWDSKYGYKISTALKQEKWDFISLQQGSGSSGIYSTYSHVEDCINLIKKDLIDVDHTQFIWNMTWAYQQDSTHGEFINYNNDQMIMYNSIISCVQKLNRDIFKVIVPNGTAIQNARTSYLGDTLTRDGFHLNVGPGRYIAALNAVKAITGIDYNDVPFSPSLDELTKKICLESVKNSWEKPYEIIKSSFRKESQEELAEQTKNMDKLTIIFIRDYYYYSIDPTNKSKPLGPNNYYICTNIFAKDKIPNGSIIRIANGYKYRPEGWVDLDAHWTGERPDNVTTEYVKVDDIWWGSFNFRAFNISSVIDEPLTNKYEEAENAFTIYIPR